MQSTHGSEVATLVDRLVRLSREDPFDPFRDLTWPERLTPDTLWMSPELMSVHGTPHFDRLSREQLIELSKFESINFYSLNVHGIRELLVEVSARIHMPGFEDVSEFFHQFIAEENEHMWYFARFCLTYGRKLYADRRLKVSGPTDPVLASFLVFARILVFEEIVDHFNTHMANDPGLDPTVKQINRLHHEDESRHIAFGRCIVELLLRRLKREYPAAALADVAEYLKRYMVVSVQSLYNPAVYRDANIPDPYALRIALLASPERRLYHERWLKRTIGFFVKQDVFAREDQIVGAATEVA